MAKYIRYKGFAYRTDMPGAPTPEMVSESTTPTTSGGGGAVISEPAPAPTTKEEYYYRKGDKFIKASRSHPELTAQGYQVLTKTEYESGKAEVKEEIKEEKIKVAIEKLGKATTEAERHKYAKEIYGLGGQLIPGEVLIKAGIEAKPGEVYVAGRDWRLPGEPKPIVSKIMTKKTPPEKTLGQLREEKLYAYINISKEIKRKYDPIDWITEAQKRGKKVLFTEALGKIPKTAIVFRPEQFSIEKDKLMLHGLPTWLEAKIRQEQLLEHQKRRSAREQYREMPVWKKSIVAVRRGLTDIPGVVDLAYLKAIGQTEKYEKRLTDVLVEEAGLEALPKEERERTVALKTFTKGAGLIAISRPVGFGITAGLSYLSTVSTASNVASKVISAGLMGYGLGSGVAYVGEPALRKEYGEALGRGVLVGGAILGVMSGSYHAKKLGIGVKPKKVNLDPEEVLLTGIKKTKGKITYRAGKLFVKTKEGIIKGNYKGKTIKNGRAYYKYDFPKQKTGNVVIKKQTVLIAEKDLITWSNKITKQLTYKKTVRMGIKTIKTAPERSLELSLKNLNEIIKVKSQTGVTKFKRAGSVKGFEAYVEKGIATQKGIVGKGIKTKPDLTYKYYFIEKEIPTTKGFDFQPVIKSIKGTDKSVTNALKQMEALRRLQSAQFQASINQGNVGRILPALLRPAEVEVKTEGVGDQIDRIITGAIRETEQHLRVKKREEYVPPVSISPQALTYRVAVQQAQQLDTPIEDIERALRQAQYIEPVSAQIRKQVRKQKVMTLQRLQPRISTPELPRIPEPFPIEVGRPGRIVPPFWSHYFYGRLGSVKAIDTVLRQIKHQLIEAEKLI